MVETVTYLFVIPSGVLNLNLPKGPRHDREEKGYGCRDDLHFRYFL